MGWRIHEVMESKAVREYLPFLEVDRRQARQAFLGFETRLSRAVLKSNPTHLGALDMLGHALTRRKRHKAALEVDKAIVALTPSDPTAWYNLACSHSNAHQIAPALKALQKAVRLGYRNFAYLLKDRDLHNLRRDARFKHWFVHLLHSAQQPVKPM